MDVVENAKPKIHQKNGYTLILYFYDFNIDFIPHNIKILLHTYGFQCFFIIPIFLRNINMIFIELLT